MNIAFSTHGEKINACRILLGHPERNRQMKKQRHRWMDNINIDLREIGWGGMDRLIWLKIGTSGRLL
jgi:hypothetical protein